MGGANLTDLGKGLLSGNRCVLVMSELLFECYGVPSVCYGIDSLFAYHHFQTKPECDALIVSFGYHTIHVIPVLNNETIFANTRRLNIGGYHVTSFLYRILQLKYPAHTTAITLSRAEELLHAICLVALDYKEELQRWTNAEYYEKHTKRIQLPYTTAVATTLTCKHVFLFLREDFIITNLSVVCIEHVDEKFIIRNNKARRCDGIIFTVPPTKIKLYDYTYPTIFHNKPSLGAEDTLLMTLEEYICLNSLTIIIRLLR